MSGVEDTPALRQALGRFIGTLWVGTPEGSTDPAMETLLDDLGVSQESREAILSIADEVAIEVEREKERRDNAEITVTCPMCKKESAAKASSKILVCPRCYMHIPA